MGSLSSANPSADGGSPSSHRDNQPSAPAPLPAPPLPAPSPDFGTTPDFGGGLSSYGSDTSLRGGSLFDEAPTLAPLAPKPTLADPLAKSDATPTLGADPTDRQTRAFNKRQEAANLKAARADSDAAWKFHQDKKAAEQKAASQRIQARRQAQAAERQQEAQARKTHRARMQAQQAQQTKPINPIKEQQRRNFEAHKAQARQVRWTQPNLRPSLANQPKGPKPVGSEEDYKRDFQRHPVTAQAEADRIVDTIPVEDWSSTQALMAQTSPGYFQSGHPANNKVRPKVDQWYKNTYPGKIDLSSGQSARGNGGMQADDRRQVDAHINAGSGTRAKAVAAYDPDVLLPSAGDASRAPDLTKRLEVHGRDRDWTPGEIEDFKDQFDALDGRDQEAYLRMLEGEVPSASEEMNGVSGGSGTDHLVGGGGDDTLEELGDQKPRKSESELGVPPGPDASRNGPVKSSPLIFDLTTGKPITLDEYNGVPETGRWMDEAGSSLGDQSDDTAEKPRGAHVLDAAVNGARWLRDRGRNTSAPPTKEDLDYFENQADMLESAGLALGWDVAAGNVRHYRDGSGEDKWIEPKFLLAHEKVKEEEQKHRDRTDGHVETTVQDRLAELPDGGTLDFGFHTITQYDLNNEEFPKSELYYASNAANMETGAAFTAIREGNRITVRGNVNRYWHDDYDWHPEHNFGIEAGGRRTIPDRDMEALADYRGAKSYGMLSEWRDDTVYTGTIGPGGEIWWDHKNTARRK
ncbi:hypothetical protein [Magnetospira sp. QH-2]|uniref:hypothetical protein n=1 Tax=Magnetospira sp. (strain QH-2) TaxID=1288970 RepID=UPI0003E80BE2|nr:hypothetical protein [Magnetospira sp. QH-2]CCQ72631.1 protein of unknown function [Magnetospira sp. QH-2]